MNDFKLHWARDIFFFENVLASLTKSICIEHCLRNGIQANKKEEGDLNLKWSIYYIQKLNSGFLYFLHPFTIYTMTHLLRSFSICVEFTFVLLRKSKNKTKTNKIKWFFLAAFFFIFLSLKIILFIQYILIMVSSLPAPLRRLPLLTPESTFSYSLFFPWKTKIHLNNNSKTRQSKLKQTWTWCFKQINNQKTKRQRKVTKPGETCADTETNVFTHTTAIPENHKTGSLNIYTEHL